MRAWSHHAMGWGIIMPSTGDVVALYSPKGGVGKTTIVTMLATEIARRGQRVAVVDCDPNGHALRCGGRFDLDGLHVVGIETEQTILPTRSRLRKEHDMVLVDLPGSASRLTLMALSRAQLALVPVQPSE